MDVQVKTGSLFRTIAEREISEIVGKIVAPFPNAPKSSGNR